MGAILHVLSNPVSSVGKASQSNLNVDELAAASRRRMMRAAWAISEDRGCTFAEAMEEARAHEEARSDFRDDLNPDTNCIIDVVRDLLNLYPIEDYRFLTKTDKYILGDVIERLIGALDRSSEDEDLDVSCELEPDLDTGGYYKEMPLPELYIWSEVSDSSPLTV